MKKLFALGSLLIVLGTSVVDVLATPPAGKWRLTFEDNFNSAGVDQQKWNIREGIRRDAFWGVEGLSAPGDGTLRVKTVHVNGKIVSGSVDTKSKFEQRFGYFEARCKLPRVAGHWSAFWLLSREFGKTDSAQLSGTEVDIFEYHTLLGTGVHHAVHWPRYGPGLQSRKQISQVPAIQDFHVFGLLWEKDRYIFYIDGKKSWEVRDGVSDVAQFVLLSNEVGPWAGPINTALLPDEMVCEYVRAYVANE